MTFVYRCQLELHDSLYFATREIGRLYETEPVLHNYALCYALGLVDSEIYSTRVAEEHSYRYFCPEQVPKLKQSEGEFTFPHPLNPLDVMFSHRVISYDVINMPPVSLIRNVKLQGQYYELGKEFDNLKIPAQMQYRFSG